MLAHADGDHARAVDLASSVVEPLAEALAFPERGHALLLLGRAKMALGDPSGLEAVRSARDVFAELGMRPALAEAEALLQGEVATEPDCAFDGRQRSGSSRSAASARSGRT